MFLVYFKLLKKNSPSLAYYSINTRKVIVPFDYAKIIFFFSLQFLRFKAPLKISLFDTHDEF